MGVEVADGLANTTGLPPALQQQLACWGLASLDALAWSRRARGLEANLRAALGLPVDAPSDQFAEAWRSRQLLALAARIVDELITGPAAPTEAPLAEQLALALAPPASPPTCPAVGPARPARARPPHGRPGARAGPADRRARPWLRSTETRARRGPILVAFIDAGVVGVDGGLESRGL